MTAPRIDVRSAGDKATREPEPDLKLAPAPIVPRDALTALIRHVGLDPADVVWLHADATTLQVDTVIRDRQGRIQYGPHRAPVTDTRTFAIEGAGQQWPGAALADVAPTHPKDPT